MVEISSSSTIEGVLSHFQDLLHELNQASVELVNAYPDVFDDPDLQAQVAAFQKAYQEATERLENPALAIATFGTTSSGKSTLVNALVGRRIAPMLNQQMSGGVLKMKAADTSRLAIDETEGAQWETGEWSELDDGETYDRVKNVMLSYHNIDFQQQERGCMAPQITVYGPLLPADNRSLLNLPSSIDVEIIDLPGLKSVQDAANLRVIQPQVGKSCSLVALDYGQIDEKHRQRLLQELKDVVKSLNGRTDSMVFVLNRVDLRTEDNPPIEEDIQRLKEEIQSVLSLQETPDVIPLSSLFIYYAQCAWGMQGGHLQSKVDPETRLAFLQAMFRDCGKLIKQNTRGDKNLRRWFRDLEDDVEDSESISDERMRHVLHYALEWSGAQKLWDTLRFRVQQSFPQLVILPALNPVFQNFDVLVAKLETIAETRKIDNQEKVEAQLERLKAERQALHKNLERLRKRFEELIADIRQDLRSDNVQRRNAAIDKAENQEIPGFKKLLGIVDTVMDEINFKLIIPVEEAWYAQASPYDLQDRLREVVHPYIAEEIGRGFDRIKDGLTHFEIESTDEDNEGNEESGYFTISAKLEDSDKIQQLEKIEEGLIRLYTGMEKALSQVAEFSIQAQAADLENVLQEFARKQAERVVSAVNEEFPELGLSKAIQADLNLILSSNPPELPENFFTLEKQIQSKTELKEEQTGSETIEYTELEWFLFIIPWPVKKHDIKPIYDTFEYKALKVPYFTTSSDEWRQGIVNSQEQLWDELSEWMIQYLDEISEQFTKAVEQVLDSINRFLEEQMKVIEMKFEEEQKRWHQLEAEKDLLVELRTLLHNRIIGEIEDE